jgi:hypothetical protein
MVRIIFLLTIILSINFQIISQSTNDKIRFVFGMFRHGARAPYSSLNENNTDVLGSKWESDSALTGVGRRQHYLMGYKNKEKYSKLLNITYRNHEEIMLFSTETSRTMMSIYSEIFGMYPTSTGPVLNESQLKFALPPINNFNFTDEISSLNFDALKKRVNPLPIRIFDSYSHFFGLNEPFICKAVGNNRDERIKSKEITEFKNMIIKLYGDKIIKILGLSNINSLNDYQVLYSLFDTFIANYYDGRNLTKFTSLGLDVENFYKLTVDFLHMDQYLVDYGDEDHYSGRMSFSPIVRYLIKIINDRINLDENGNIADIYNPQNPKMLLFSAHDTSLAALTVFFRYMFGEKVKYYYPYFASSYYIEVFRKANVNSNDKDEIYYLNILFNEENILGESISFKDFKQQIENELISESEINQYCGFDNNNKDYKTSRDILLHTCIAILLLIILIFLTFFYLKLKIKTKREIKIIEEKKEPILYTQEINKI